MHVQDFQVVNGCQTTMTLFENSAKLVGTDDCLVDLKIIHSKGLRNKISETTNTQTAIVAEHSFSNEPEQRKIKDVLKRHDPPYYYSPKRGSWDREKSAERRRYLATDGRFGKYRKLTSKELAAVCLAAFGEPEAAKDRPRMAFDRPGGKPSADYQRIFGSNNTAAQWVLPFELLRCANSVARSESEKNALGERARVSEYGRYRMVHLAYRFLAGRAGAPADFMSAAASQRYLDSLSDWGRELMQLVVDGLVDAYSDAQKAGETSGLREFFREKRHQPMIDERFARAQEVVARMAERDGKTLDEYLGLPR